MSRDKLGGYKGLTLFQGIQVQFSAPTLGVTQAPAAPASGDVTAVLASTDICTHM